MDIESQTTILDDSLRIAELAINDVNTYIQLLVLVSIYMFSFTAAYKIRHSFSLTLHEPLQSAHPVRILAFKVGELLFPFFAIVILQISTKASENLTFTPWLIEIAVAMAVLLFFNSLIRVFVQAKIPASFFR